MPINFSNFITCSGTPCNPIELVSPSGNGCECTTFSGRINDLYFVDCSLVLKEQDIIDPAWWTANLTAGKIIPVGVGIGGYQKKDVTTFDAGGCGEPSVEKIVWQLTYKLLCIDKSAAKKTHDFADALMQGALSKYNLIIRYCDGQDTIAPIGGVSLADFDNLLPEATSEFMEFSFEFNWNSMTAPRPLDVPGLNAVLPKAARG
jgi:hypothetical protein